MAATDPRVHTLTLKCCTQLMKTELLNNILGYHIHLDPAPIIMMLPTEKLAKGWSTERLDKMIRDTPVLAESFGAKKSRDSVNTMLKKEFPGGYLAIVGANAPTDLSSRPVRIILCDEIDKYPQSAGKEGDPIKLVSERTTTFWNALKVHTCSPTIEGNSRIELEYEQSDKRVYHVPCPHCKTFDEMHWKQVQWEKANPETALYYCAHCGEEWSEPARLKAIQKGKWVATAPFKGHAGFKANKLVSPWEPMSAIARKFLEAKKGGPEALKVFVNTQLAETWTEKGEAPEWERLYERRETYEMGTVPNGVLFLTAGVDIQDKRIEVEVTGWGRGKESWSIQTYVLEGDTAVESHEKHVGPWLELDKVMNETWENGDGHRLSIAVMAVDSGYRTQTVYNWCRRYPMNRVIAVKGSDKLQILMNSGTIVDLKRGKRRYARGFRMYTVGVGIIKSELYGWLKLPKPTRSDEVFPPGYCHFPEYEDEYFKQLTAEQMMKKLIMGRAFYFWEKVRDRNEALDMRVYSRAAASFYGIDRWKAPHWDQLAAQIAKNCGKINVQLDERPKLKRRPSKFL